MKNYNKCKSIQLIMIHPTGFSDSENIIIIDNVPYFHYTSSTYKDKLKNGLSLEYVFEQEYMIPIAYEEVVEAVESHDTRVNLKFVDYEEKYEFYEEKEFQTCGLTRKGNWRQFKNREARNTKKNSIKINGYTDKLFAIEQKLPELLDESRSEINYEYSDIYDDYHDDYSIPCDYFG